MHLSHKCLGILLLSSIFFSSCSKSDETIVVPTACFHMEELEVSTSQSMVFENCSESDLCFLRVYDAADFEEGEDMSQVEIIQWDFNETPFVEHQFSLEKRYIAELFCQNKQPGSPVIMKTLEFEVKD